MAYGSVHIPAGCTVKIGDTVGGLASLGVLKGDATIGITYDNVKVLGSKAEKLLDGIKNMEAEAAFELYQLYLPNIKKLLDGAVTVNPIAAAPVPGAVQVVASGAWGYNDFIPIEHQNGAGTIITINSVTGSVDGVLVAETDYFEGQNELGIWGIFIINSVTVTTEVQNITINYDYTPNAAYQLLMGEAYAELVAKIVEFSKTIDGKNFWARLWSVTNSAGLTLSFLDSAGDEPQSLPVTLAGGLDTARAAGEQLIEIYDEIGLIFP